jgi:F-box domain
MTVSFKKRNIEKMIVNPSLQANNYLGTSQLHADILTRIFLSLDFSSLKFCPRVCRQWKNIVFHPNFQYVKRLLEKKYGKAGSDHLNDLIQNKQFTLENLIQYVPLIKFFNFSFATYVPHDTEYTKRFDNHVQKPFCCNEWLNVAYASDNSTVLVVNLRTRNEVILKPEIKNDGDLIRVCAIDDYVFGLCLNGEIIQWDFQSGNQIQIIKTSLCKRVPDDINSIIFSSVNDCLFLSYQKHEKAFIDIISYELHSQNLEVDFESTTPAWVVGVEGERIYLNIDGLIIDKNTGKRLAGCSLSNATLFSEQYLFKIQTDGFISVLDRILVETLDELKMPEIVGNVIKSKLFHSKEYLICFSTSDHNNVLSHYFTIWRIKSYDMLYHSVAKENSLQEIIEILEFGSLQEDRIDVLQSQPQPKNFFENSINWWENSVRNEAKGFEKYMDCIIS